MTYPKEFYPGCPCYTCDSTTWDKWPGTEVRIRQRMSVCPDCGNKRCPAATNHENACTASNEPGQEGSMYA